MSDGTDREPEELDVAECLRLITPGGIGRIAHSGRYGCPLIGSRRPRAGTGAKVRNKAGPSAPRSNDAEARSKTDLRPRNNRSGGQVPGQERDGLGHRVLPVRPLRQPVPLVAVD